MKISQEKNIDISIISMIKTKYDIDINQIPTGNNSEDRAIRKSIINLFYKKWGDLNPDRKIYNESIKDYIRVTQISVNETSYHASKNYYSTMAVLQLDTILEIAKKTMVVNTKPKDKNQNQFEKMIKMECDLIGVGKVLLLVGIKRPNRNGSKDKVQYCITSIDV